ncbi:MAG: polynucleotide adenylyltransferase PcnB, partial [Gammaproteobacteria bacterium]|nr:polynucleotide adenylyltransferase PcnB [Gammaproteobacteria bacterium]
NIHHLSEHDFNLDSISVNAIKVVHRLKSHGYQAYLVGGCVRDLLLSHHPKDFDVATNALPEEVRKLFRNSNLIGRRFRLAHIRFGREIIEVATFRGSGNDRDNLHKTSHQVHENGRILRDNVYGSMNEDALRRDFTVNALYLDPEQEEVLDRVGGMHDHHNKLIRLIGNPEDRYREDPVRLLRAIRFSAKLDFQIETETLQPIAGMGSLLQGVPQARLYEELLKLFLSGHAFKTFESLCEFDLLKHLFPQTSQLLEQGDHDSFRHLITLALQSTDNRVQANKPVTAYFLFAALLWGAIQSELSRQTKTENQYMDMQEAMNTVLREQGKTIALPKRATIPMREVWTLQPRFYQRHGAKPHRLLEHPRFRAAYDFILIRAETGVVESELAEWWTRFQTVSPSQRRKMTQSNRRRSRNNKKADVSSNHATQNNGDV